MLDNLPPILKIAYEILAENKEPMHLNAITLQAIQKGQHLNLTYETFAKKLGSAIRANIDSKKSLFANVQNKNGSNKKGVYRHKRISKPLVVIPGPPSIISGRFLGKAGEYSVMSELLFWEYNVSLMTVDDGIDVIAEKNNKYFHLQVKTTTGEFGDTFRYTIKKQSFENNSSTGTFYIFVMRTKTGSQYMVIPSSDIENQYRLGVITGDTALSIGIYYDKTRKVHLLNRRHNISGYLNNFHQLK